MKPIVTCTGCRQLRPHRACGLCNACYQRAKPKVVRKRDLRLCSACGLVKPYKGKGLCTTCHAAQQPRLVAPCTACGVTRAIVSKGRCESCYDKARRPKIRLPKPEACSECSRPAADGRYLKGRCYRCHERLRSRMRTWAAGICCECGSTKPIVAKGMCLVCFQRLRTRERWATDPEFRFNRKAFQRRRRDLLMESDGSHTRTEWLERVAEYNGCCAYCLQPLDVPTRDHMTPVTWPLGTSDAIENIVPACGPCNSLKGDDNLLLYLRARTLASTREAAPSPPTGS